MATFQHTSPASLRSSSRVAHENRSAGLDPRPYLVTLPARKPVRSTQQYLALFPHESEDARLTGATRSLYRRLLALNLPGTTTHTKAAVSAVTADGMEVVYRESHTETKFDSRTGSRMEINPRIGPMIA
jgi:hypothetical protein